MEVAATHPQRLEFEVIRMRPTGSPIMEPRPFDCYQI